MGFFGGSAASPAIAGIEAGCKLRAVAADEPAGTTLRGFGPELDGAELFVRPAGFDGAAGFVSRSPFPWGCDGGLATGSAATDACAFDVDAGPAWTPPDCCCMHHQPPPPSSSTPASIAPIKMPLLELLSSLTVSALHWSALSNASTASSVLPWSSPS